LDDDEGYLNDPTLDMTKCTEMFSQTQYDKPLDWGTDSAQDNQSSDEDSVSNEIAAMAGISVSHLPRLPLDGWAMLPLVGRASLRVSKERKGALGVMTGIITHIAMHTTIMATIG
jgi:hypothetical protein